MWRRGAFAALSPFPHRGFAKTPCVPRPARTGPNEPGGVRPCTQGGGGGVRRCEHNKKLGLHVKSFEHWRTSCRLAEGRPARESCARHGPRGLAARLRGPKIHTKWPWDASAHVAKAHGAELTHPAADRAGCAVSQSGGTEGRRGRADACDVTSVDGLEGPAAREPRASTSDMSA